MDLRGTLRLEASAQCETSSRQVRSIVCPACGQRVYPRHPTVPQGRYFWSQGPHTAYACPLENKTIVGPDRINALIFRGRQEGDAHRNLVALLKRLAEQDPKTITGTVELDKYEPPSPAIRNEFPYGRFPDVRFMYGTERVVLEAQLASITLHGINGRRSFYDRGGACLLWIARQFDPRLPLRAYSKDLIADQKGVLFSVDDEIESLSAGDNKFRLRAWYYEYSDGSHNWAHRIVDLDEAILVAKPQGWHDNFKRRWRKAFSEKSYIDDDTADPMVFLNELAERANLGRLDSNEQSECLLRLIRLLISLEAGQVYGLMQAAISR